MECKVKVSIVVCTRNRSTLLYDCLSTLVSSNQQVPESLYEVIVVDNNSTDNTQNVVESFTNRYKNFQYIIKRELGLSYCRNAGYKNSASEWIAYMDDDALARNDFVSRCLETIASNSFDMFGGMYYPWYKYGKPRWLSRDFGEKPFVRDGIGSLPENGFISGGIMAIRKSVLTSIGGFPVDLGMKGNKIAYGEEILLQKQLRDSGYKLGFDPEWKMDHLVAAYKLKPLWHLKSTLASQRDMIKAQGVLDVTDADLLLQLRKMRIYFLKHFKLAFARYKTDKNYYRQNLLIDSFRPIAQIIGRYKGTKAVLNTNSK